MFKKKQGYEPDARYQEVVSFNDYRFCCTTEPGFKGPTTQQIGIINNWFLGLRLPVSHWSRIVQAMGNAEKLAVLNAMSEWDAKLTLAENEIGEQGRLIGDLKLELADSVIEIEFLNKYIASMELRDRGLVDTIEFLETDNEYLADTLDKRDAEIKALVKKSNKKGKKK